MTLASDRTRFICLFHGADRARAAVSALESLNFGPGAVNTIGDGAESTAGSQTLEELGVPDRDLEHLQDGLRHGGVVISVEAPESRSAEIERIFHRYSAEKIDETEIETAAAAAPAAYAGTGRADTNYGASETAAAVAPAAYAGTGRADTNYGASEPAAGTTVVPVAQEELVVGKREVDRGGVRVYRRTVDEPVRQDVDLHAERVVLEYREVNRPVTDADLQAGAQEIELVETAEVPVVQKVARVVEEVRVGKVETDRTEVVEDTVRHTEVDVQPLEDRERTGRE